MEVSLPIMSSIVSLLLSLVLAGVATVAQAAETMSASASGGCNAALITYGRELHQTIDVNGTTRNYILDVPPAIDPKTPVPLLFDFHGFGHSAQGVWKVSKFKDLAPSKQFITVYPDGLPVHLLNRDAPGWDIFTVDGNRDLAFTRQLLDRLEQTYCIDRARVYTTGFSNGAFFSNILGCTMADRFAAIAPVSGGRITVPCAPTRAVPVMIYHGRDDTTVPVAQAHRERDAWLETDGCQDHHDEVSDGCERHRQCRDSAEVVYCETDGGHHWPPAATQQIWDFFERHPLPMPAAHTH